MGNGVVSTALTIRASVAKTGDGGVDDLWVDLLYRIVAQPQAVHDARTVVLDDDVTLRCQLHEDFHATWVFVIQRQALLVAIEHRKHGALAVLQLPQYASRVTAAHLLDLDHLGAHIS